MSINETIEEYHSAGEKGIQTLTLAKGAIESLRNDISSKSDVLVCKRCKKKHPPYQPCDGTESQVKSKDLTRKAIQILCGNKSTMKAVPNCNISDKDHRPLSPLVVESEANVRTSTAAIAIAAGTEEKGQSQAKLTELHGLSTKTATCQCCDKEGVPVIDLVKIDSGQLLCPDCLKSLRDAASRKAVPH